MNLRITDFGKALSPAVVLADAQEDITVVRLQHICKVFGTGADIEVLQRKSRVMSKCRPICSDEPATKR